MLKRRFHIGNISDTNHSTGEAALQNGVANFLFAVQFGADGDARVIFVFDGSQWTADVVSRKSVDGIRVGNFINRKRFRANVNVDALLFVAGERYVVDKRKNGWSI